MHKAKSLVYICHPFSNNPEENIENIKKICRNYVDQNEIPIAPQLLFPQFMNDETEREAAMDACIALMLRCHRVDIHGDFISNGMEQELLVAVRDGMSIVSFNPQWVVLDD